jgi:hypothetical protein
MKIKIPILCLALACLWGQVDCRADDGAIGSVRVVKGQAFVERGGRRMAAHIKLRIKQGDVLITGSGGALGITLRDNTRLSLGPDSRLVIDRFLFSPADKKFSLITTLLKGTAAFVTGRIGQLAPDAVKVKTPVATIGIRGTRFVVKADQI